MRQVAGRTDRGVVRLTNEDALWIDDRYFLCCVCDGMGGHAGGEIASAMIVDVFKTYDILETDLQRDFDVYFSNPALSLDENNFINAVRFANEKIYQRSEQEILLKGMGSTVVGLYVRRDRDVCVVNVGDSRAYHVTPQGIRQITVDHSWIQEHGQHSSKKYGLDDAAMERRWAHVLTRAVGTEPRVHVDFFKEPLHEGYYMLCSDGLTGHMSDSMIHETIWQTQGAVEDKVEALLTQAKSLGGSDNVSIVLVDNNKTSVQ